MHRVAALFVHPMRHLSPCPTALFYKDNEHLQLHKGINQFEVKQDAEIAFSLLHNAFHLTAHQEKAMTEREMQILASNGAIHYSLHQNNEALHYFNQVETAMNTTGQLQDKSIKTKLFYTIARVLTRLGELEESSEYCCFDQELLWRLGELHYHIDYNYELKNDTMKPFLFSSVICTCLSYGMMNLMYRFLHQRLRRFRNCLGHRDRSLVPDKQTKTVDR